MTKQEIFDTVARHLLAQGKPAYENSQCNYLASDGCKCAAGALIPADKYDRAIEGDSISGDGELHGPADRFFDHLGFDQEQRVLLADLQRAHDTPAFDFNSKGVPWLPVWKARMVIVAEVHDLDASVLGA